MFFDRQKIEDMFEKISERLDAIDSKLDENKVRTEPLDGDRLLDNQYMCQFLNISKRTLAGYRQKKLIPYYIIDGKSYYKASEVQGFFKKKGKL